MPPQSILIVLALLVASTLAGCVEEPAPPPAQPAAAPSSAWKDVNGARVVAADESADAALAAAIKQAQATAETARARWAAAHENERERWAIKWAAPTTDRQAEHVWVRPVNWSPFRVEGVLISQPVVDLECGRREGELVSFPVEELSDWIHYLDESAANAGREFEGGFTVQSLEARFGRP